MTTYTLVSLAMSFTALALTILSLRLTWSRKYTLMSALDDLKAQVTATVGAEASAVTLIQGLAAKLDAAVAASDLSAVAALTAELKSGTDAIAAAVAAHADATTPPTPAPAPASPAA